MNTNFIRNHQRKTSYVILMWMIEFTNKFHENLIINYLSNIILCIHAKRFMNLLQNILIKTNIF